MNLVDWLWTLLVFFFMVMYFILLFRIIVDIFRSDDLSGFAKALWLIALFVFTIFSALIYVIVRPRMTEQDRQIAAEMMERQRRLEGYSSAEELAKLRHAGTITPEEYEQLKSKAMP